MKADKTKEAIPSRKEVQDSSEDFKITSHLFMLKNCSTMPTELDEFHELLYYTLAHPDKAYFIHQHCVDAFQAQTANSGTRAIGVVFALIGLYLYLEKGFSGKQVQKAHMKLSENKKAWPLRPLPVERGSITVSNVLKSVPGPDRDQMITAWCSSVWNAYKEWHETIRLFTDHELHLWDPYN